MAIYTELTERARYLAANSAAFQAATGSSDVNDAYSRWTSLNEFIALDGDMRKTPYVIVSYPLSVWSRSISTGQGMENVRGGSVEVLIVQWVGKEAEANPPEEAAFMSLAGSLFEEMDSGRDSIISPAETSSGLYTFFDEFTTERDLERSPFSNRDELDDYMFVGWRLSSNPAGGAGQ